MCPVKTRADSSTGDVNNNNGGTAEESPSSPALLKEAEGSYGDQLSGVSINELLRAKCAKESDQGPLSAKSSEELRDIYRRLQDAVKEVGDKYEAGEKAVRDADPSIEPGPTKKSEEEHALDFLRVAREILVADGIRILTILSKRETETSTEVSPAKVIVEEVETVIEETAAADDDDEDLPELEDSPPKQSSKRKLRRFRIRDFEDDDVETQKDEKEAAARDLEEVLTDDGEGEEEEDVADIDCACHRSKLVDQKMTDTYKKKIEEVVSDSKHKLGSEAFMNRLHEVVNDMLPRCHCFTPNQAKKLICKRCAETDERDNKNARSAQSTMLESLHMFGQYPITEQLLTHRGRTWKVPRNQYERQVSGKTLIVQGDPLGGNLQLFEPQSEGNCTHVYDLHWLRLVLPTLLHLLETLRLKSVALSERNIDFITRWISVQTRVLLGEKADFLETACYKSSHDGYRSCLMRYSKLFSAKCFFPQIIVISLFQHRETVEQRTPRTDGAGVQHEEITSTPPIDGAMPSGLRSCPRCQEEEGGGGGRRGQGR
jgi:hypothetical protein